MYDKYRKLTEGTELRLQLRLRLRILHKRRSSIYEDFRVPLLNFGNCDDNEKGKESPIVSK